MKILSSKINNFFIKLFFLLPGFCFALNNNTVSNPTGNTGGVQGIGGQISQGMNSGTSYLTYAMWAASVMGILAIGFMLFANVQDTILKSIIRGVAVICVIAMAFFVPMYFGLPINFNY